MKTKMFTALTAIAILASACQNKASLTGQWIEPIPGNPDAIQGIDLKENGEASSINMATLQYEQWSREGDRLILSGESIGNHQTIAFADTFEIGKLTADSLVLKKGDYVMSLARPQSSIPATLIQPATPLSFTVNGRLIIGHEVRSFIADGDTAEYWIIDETDSLKPLYEKAVGEKAKPYTAVKASLRVVDAGKSAEGFAAEALLLVLIEQNMVRHDDLHPVGNQDLRLRNACLLHSLQLLDKGRDGKGHAVSDDTGGVLIENTAGQQVKRKTAIVVDDGMTGVGAALITDDNVGSLGQKVSDLTLSFISPVCTYDCTNHIKTSS